MVSQDADWVARMIRTFTGGRTGTSDREERTAVPGAPRSFPWRFLLIASTVEEQGPVVRGLEQPDPVPGPRP